MRQCWRVLRTQGGAAPATHAATAITTVHDEMLTSAAVDDWGAAGVWAEDEDSSSGDVVSGAASSSVIQKEDAPAQSSRSTTSNDRVNATHVTELDELARLSIGGDTIPPLSTTTEANAAVSSLQIAFSVTDAPRGRMYCFPPQPIDTCDEPLSAVDANDDDNDDDESTDSDDEDAAMAHARRRPTRFANAEAAGRERGRGAVATPSRGALQNSHIRKLLAEYEQHEATAALDVVPASNGAAAAGSDDDDAAADQGRSRQQQQLLHRDDGGGAGEAYERIPLATRYALHFAARLRRLPEQVVRYAYGLEPLWPVPPALLVAATGTTGRGPSRGSTRGSRRPGATAAAQPAVATLVQPCPGCGSARVFEAQLMPHLLTALRVDDFIAEVLERNADKDTPTGVSTASETVELKAPASSAAEPASSTAPAGRLLSSVIPPSLDFSSVLIFSCPFSCNGSREECAVVVSATE